MNSDSRETLLLFTFIIAQPRYVPTISESLLTLFSTDPMFQLVNSKQTWYYTKSLIIKHAGPLRYSTNVKLRITPRCEKSEPDSRIFRSARSSVENQRVGAAAQCYTRGDRKSERALWRWSAKWLCRKWSLVIRPTKWRGVGRKLTRRVTFGGRFMSQRVRKSEFRARRLGWRVSAAFGPERHACKASLCARLHTHTLRRWLTPAVW